MPICALRSVHVYHSSPSPTLDVEALGGYLDEMLPGVEVHLHAAYEEALGAVEATALAAGIIEGIAAPTDAVEMAGVEPVVYNAFNLAAAMADVIPPEQSRLDCLHIDLCHRLMGTWDERDNRYHLRTVLCWQPSIVSIPGLVEAPTRPRKYAIMRMQFEALRMEDAIAELDEKFAGAFLAHDDERLTEVAKGYVLQAVFYRLTGEAFCDDPSCRLVDAHWQEDMLAAQLGGRLCERHEAVLRALQ